MFIIWLIVWIALTLFLIKWYSILSAGRCYSSMAMTGKVVIITGANSGIGYETALNLAKRGAKLILACRSDIKGQKAVDEIIKASKNKFVRYEYLDLSSFDSIRQFVDIFKRSEVKLDVLINNAGASGMCGKKSADGIVTDMQVNHFGPFLLTVLLVPMLKKSAPSRIVNVSSFLHKIGTIEKVNEEGRYGYLRLFANSKLCNVLFSNELAKRLEGTGVDVNCLHPGQVNTTFYQNTKLLEMLRSLLLFPFFKCAKEGAQTSLFLAVSADVDGITGKYFVDCQEAKTSRKAMNEDLAANMWSMSEELVRLKPEEEI